MISKQATKELKECPVCGQWMERKYLKNHNCPGNRDNVEIIENFINPKS